MKRLSNYPIFILILVLILSLLPGCSAQSKMEESVGDSSPSESPGIWEKGEDRGSGEREDGDLVESEASQEEDDSKIITSMEIFMETRAFDKTISKLEGALKKHSAYIESSSISHDGYYDGKRYKYGDFRIRVPKDKLDSFKADLYGMGNMVSENTQREDVSKVYRDSESRLKVITTKEKRILALLEKADKIEDIIALEKELGEIIYEKESLQASLLNLDHKVDYATISMEIREVAKLSDQENIETSFATRVKNAFKNSLYGFNLGLQNFIIWLIYSLPLLILILILAYLGYRIFKRIREKNKS